jgi:hypothetical protein
MLRTQLNYHLSYFIVLILSYIRYSCEWSDSEWWSTFLSQWNFGRARDKTIDTAEDTELQQKVRYTSYT